MGNLIVKSLVTILAKRYSNYHTERSIILIGLCYLILGIFVYSFLYELTLDLG